jgi:uncharacterized damage-inducible protein DinB
MFRYMDDFMNAYGSLIDGTKKIFDKLTDENIHQKVAEGHRELGHIAWHIVATVPDMINQTGLGMSGLNPGTIPPGTAAEIQAGYKKVSQDLITALEDKWNDDSLEEVDEMYGEQWPRGLTLAILVDHEVHHRGQMTVLLRQAGEVVPGIYGPAQEEWGQHGMELPPY